MKIQLTDPKDVGKLQRDAIASLNESIDAVRADKLASYQVIFTKIAETVGGFNDFSVVTNKRGVNVQHDTDVGPRDVAEVYIDEPWSWKKDDTNIKIDNSLTFYSLNTLAQKAEVINMAVEIENLLNDEKARLEEIYGNSVNAQSDLIDTKRQVKTDLEILKFNAEQENFETLKKALIAGIDLRNYVPGGRQNFEFYATQSDKSDFQAVILKAAKVNKKTMILEIQSQHKYYDYDTNSYGEFELSQTRNQKVKNEYFLSRLQDVILKALSESDQ